MSDLQGRQWEPPKSLSEMQMQADGDDGRGIRCPRCGCPHLAGQRHLALRTIASGLRRSIRRYRICRNPACGHQFTTMETVIG